MALDESESCICTGSTTRSSYDSDAAGTRRVTGFAAGAGAAGWYTSGFAGSGLGVTDTGSGVDLASALTGASVATASDTFLLRIDSRLRGCPSSFSSDDSICDSFSLLASLNEARKLDSLSFLSSDRRKEGMGPFPRLSSRDELTDDRLDFSKWDR